MLPNTIKPNTIMPISPLDYKDRILAKPKELLIDYADHKIYICDQDNKFVDVTKAIYDKIENLSGDKLTLIMPGIGEVNLTQYIYSLKQELDRCVKVILDEDKTIYFPKNKTIDQASLEFKYNYLQIVGFDKAPNNCVPQKNGNKIVWVALTDDSGSNSDDGKISSVFNIHPINGKINLRVSKEQITKGMTEKYEIVLPITQDDFSEIYWNLQTFDSLFEVTFKNNIYFKNSGKLQPIANAINLYKFITYDKGNSWMAELVYYTSNSEGGDIDYEFLNSTFVRKKDLESNYYDTGEMSVLYDSKIGTALKYYNKDEVDDKLSWFDANDINISKTEV